jgi:AraC-like DNA-binding protein
MKLTIESLKGNRVKFSDNLPGQFAGPRLPGGEVLSATGDFGELCIQEFDGGNFVIRYSVLQTKENFAFDAHNHYSGLYTLIMLKNEVHPLIDGKELKIDEGQFTLIEARDADFKLDLQGMQQYISFEALFAPLLAKSIFEDFPEMSDALHDLPELGPNVLVDPAKWIDPEVRDHIHYILTYSDPVKWRRNYFENRVWDIVWKLVAIHLNENPEGVSITETEKQTAYDVQRLILDNLDKHLLVKELAHEVGMSESGLKRIFAIVYGMGMHEYRIYERLKKAIELLNGGLSVKEAAARTGWRSADLIRAYYKVYGTTPGSAKKKK